MNLFMFFAEAHPTFANFAKVVKAESKNLNVFIFFAEAHPTFAKFAK